MILPQKSKKKYEDLLLLSREVVILGPEIIHYDCGWVTKTHLIEQLNNKATQWKTKAQN